MYKIHPDNVETLKRHLQDSVCEYTTTVISETIVADVSVPRSEVVIHAPVDRWVEWEERDIEWAEFFGFLVSEVRIPYKKSLGLTLNMKLNTFDVRRFQNAYISDQRHSRGTQQNISFTE